MADGIDPFTGELLPQNHVCNQPEMIRAFHELLNVIPWPQKKNLPRNAGKPWTDIEEEKLLEERKRNAKLIKVKAERVINKAPVRMQRIIRFRVMQGLTWDSVAIKMGGRCTKDSVRMEFQNWMKEK